MKLAICGLLFLVVLVNAEESKRFADAPGLAKRRNPRLRFLGCFVDRHQRALPYYLGYFGRNVGRCARTAFARGFVVFSVQYGGQCWSGPRAQYTYNKYGKSKKCGGWVGGTWANDVYRFIKIPAYRYVGCFRDTGRRALPVYLGTFRGDIARCSRVARAHGYKVFSVQYGGQCFSGPTAGRTYFKYGLSNKCRNGFGGTWANDVYRFRTGRKLRKINRNPVCFRASRNRPGVFRYYGPGRIVKGIELVYRRGHVTCHYRNRNAWSRWGCGGTHLNVVITDQYNYLIYPRKEYIENNSKWYRLPGKHSKHSFSLFFSNVAAPFHLTTAMSLKVWYGEDLTGITEGDNRGLVCVDVYAWFA